MSGPLTFLAASPHLQGTFFEKAVILLLEHDERGAMGLVVNDPLPQSVAELLEEAEDQRGPVWLGGPVDATSGWCLYRDPLNLEGELRLTPELCISSSMEVRREVIASGQDYMLVLGYAGWAPGQLTEEARQGTWLWVEQDTPALLWDVPAEGRWRSALDSLGVDPVTIVAGGAQA